MPEAVTHVGSGKVRELYEVDDERLLLVASDRISTFDVVLPTEIPDKGRVLTGLSGFWFARTRELVANHLLALRADGRSTECRKLEMLPLECVVRGYLTGSGWKDYQATGSVCGHLLGEGLRDSDKLPEPIFTPATKAEEGHDENIDRERAAELVGQERLDEVERVSIGLYRFASEYAAKRGILIADTKFEFGLDPEGGSCSATKRSRPTRRASGRPTSTSPDARSPPSTSSSCATTARRSAGTRPRRGQSCPRTSLPARAPATSRRSSG